MGPAHNVNYTPWAYQIYGSVGIYVSQDVHFVLSFYAWCGMGQSQGCGVQHSASRVDENPISPQAEMKVRCEAGKAAHGADGCIWSHNGTRLEILACHVPIQRHPDRIVLH